MARATKSLINTAELGRAIRRRREELALSLRDVADETSVSASTLSRIENGTGKPDADNIARLTSWLDVPLERILKGTREGREETKAIVYYPHEPFAPQAKTEVSLPRPCCMRKTKSCL